MKFEYAFEEETKYEYGIFELPSRSTANSAGYDFHCPLKFKLKKGKTVKIPLYVKATDMPKDSVLLITNRSSLALKYGITIDNAVGVIDSDFNSCIWLQITNNGKKTYQFNINDKICQGIFVKYLVIDNDAASDIRLGGIGSTGK